MMTFAADYIIDAFLDAAGCSSLQTHGADMQRTLKSPLKPSQGLLSTGVPGIEPRREVNHGPPELSISA